LFLNRKNILYPSNEKNELIKSLLLVKSAIPTNGENKIVVLFLFNVIIIVYFYANIIYKYEVYLHRNLKTFINLLKLLS